MKVRVNEGVGKMTKVTVVGNGEIRFGAKDDNVGRIGIESSSIKVSGGLGIDLA